MMVRTFVTSDTHGCADRLASCLRQANFDYDVDQLIHLGDCVDRGPDSKGVVDLLLKIKNLIAIKGNHDDWFLEFIETGFHGGLWQHGGYATKESYMSKDYEDLDIDRKNDILTLSIPNEHREFFRTQRLYYIDDQNRFFCHAGFNRHYSIEEQQDFMFYWDRDLFLAALSTGKISFHEGMGEESPLIKNARPKLKIKDNFKRVFIGHTPTINWKEGGKAIDTPIYASQVVNIDTGGCFGGKISLLDITEDDNHILYQA